MNIRSNKLRALLLATTLVAGAGGVAIAQQAGTQPVPAPQAAATYDPAQLPATHGKVAEYSLTPRGDVDGLILADGTEVHLPPHLGAQLVFVAKPGDAVTIHGLKARELAMIQAMQVTNDATNQSVTDTGHQGGPREGKPPHGPGHEHGPDAMRGTPIEAQGSVKQALHGPRGEVNGVLLSDGTIVRIPPPDATRLSTELAVGQTVFVRGDGSSSALGRVVAARAVGPDAQHLTTLQLPRPSHGPRDEPGREAGQAHPLPPEGGPGATPSVAPPAPPPAPAG